MRSIRSCCLAIGVCGAGLVFGFGTMAATMRLAGAVMASGSVVVKSAVKKVAHQTGGIVGIINVDNGSHVKAGDVLVHLDETVAKASVAALTRDSFELQTQRARLEAERDGAATLIYADELRGAARDPDILRILAGEKQLFAIRRQARIGRKNQLNERIRQLKNEIDGLEGQMSAKDGELAIIRKELVGVRDLYARNLVQMTRLDGLERDAARIAGERGALAAHVAQTKGRIAETELQIIQVDEDMRSEVCKQLADIRAKASDVIEKRVTAEDRLEHLDIRAPQDGVVHELSVHAKGAVISPGEQVMLIVPDQDRLVAEVRVAPEDIDKVEPEQLAILRFPSFNQRTTPELDSHVSRVAVDTSQDPRGTPYYVVQIALPENVEVGGVKLRPGMPVEAFVKTSERTLLSYLVKPLGDQMGKAFREK